MVYLLLRLEEARLGDAVWKDEVPFGLGCRGALASLRLPRRVRSVRSELWRRLREERCLR